MVTVGEICRVIETEYPLTLQEKYDNSGLQVGDRTSEVTKILLSLDVTENVVREAISLGCEMIISHHPILFKPLRSITGSTYEQRVVTLALKHGIALYASHTNHDNTLTGLNGLWANRMGLKDLKVIKPQSDNYYKVTIYVPEDHAHTFYDAFHGLGWGGQGNYSNCSFTFKGEGRFTPLSNANPYVGTLNSMHVERECAISIIVPKTKLLSGLDYIKSIHPYEEPAVDIMQLEYQDFKIGSGVIGDFENSMTFDEFIKRIKEMMPWVKNICSSKVYNDKIQRVAYCGGSGAFLIQDAISLGADIYITGEAKYNDFYDVQGRITLLTLGHYESELISLDCFKNIISKNFSNFVTVCSLGCKNPIDYI